MALTSKKTKELADKLSKEIKYLELGAEQGFKREFTEFTASTMLPHRDLTKYPSVRKYMTNQHKTK